MDIEAIPMEWVDKVFALLDEYFGQSWSYLIKDKEHQMKLQWQHGLMGLNREEIKSGLFVARNMARNKQLPPNVIEFYHYSKGLRQPPRPLSRLSFQQNQDISVNSIKNIKEILRKTA